jgi:c-di-GMP-binding flagellar brake protein YcgR
MSGGPTTLEEGEVGSVLRELTAARTHAKVLERGEPLCEGRLSEVLEGLDLLFEVDDSARGGRPPRPLFAGQRVDLELVFDGIPFHMTVVVARARAGGDPSVRFRKPEVVRRLQRRAHFRVSAEPGSELAAREREVPVAYPIVEFSGGGVGLVVDVQAGQILRTGKRFAVAELRLPGEDVFVGSASVCHVMHLGAGATASLRCGVSFAAEGPRTRERLARAVARRERDILGKRVHARTAVPRGSMVLLSPGTPRARVRRMLDVSAGGVLFELEPNADQALVAGATIDALEVRVLGYPPVAGRGIVRRVVRTGADAACGVELLDVDEPGRVRLSQLARHFAAPKSVIPR